MSPFLVIIFTLLTAELCIMDNINQPNVISHLRSLFSIKCVFIVSTERYKSKAIEIQKILSRSEEGSSIFSSSTFDSRSVVKCRENRPLYVIFPDQETLRHLESLLMVPSYPRWLFFTETDSIVNILANIHIPFDCEFFVACVAHPDHVVLTEVYRLDKGRPLNTNRFGKWTPGTGWKTSNLSLYARRSDLQGLVLKGVRYSPPIRRELQLIENREVFWHNGLVASVWHVLESRINFTTSISSPADGVFGFQAPNGTWTGMIGALVDRKASVAIDDVTVSTRRMDVVDFLIPLLNNRIYIHIRKPDKAIHWNNFSPFSWTTWSATVGFILIAGVTSTVARGVLCRTAPADQEDDLQPPTLLEALVEVLALFCQQGKVGPTHFVSVRVVLVSAGYASVILLAAYSGILTSLLAVGHFRLPFDSLRGFMDDGSYTLGLERSAAQIYFDQNTSNPVVRELYTRHVAPYEARDESIESDAGMRALCARPRFTWLTSETFEASNDFGATAGCEVAVVPEHVTVQTVSIAVAKGMPFRGLLNHNIRYLRDTGILTHIKTLVKREQLSSTEPVTTPPVTQEQVLAVQLALALGVVCSVCVLLGEKLRSKLQSRRAHKVRPRLVRLGRAKTRK